MWDVARRCQTHLDKQKILGSHHPCTLSAESNSDKDGQDDGVTKERMCVLSVDCINICDHLALSRWQKKALLCFSKLADPNSTILVGTYVCSRSHGCGEGQRAGKGKYIWVQ